VKADAIYQASPLLIQLHQDEAAEKRFKARGIFANLYASILLRTIY